MLECSLYLHFIRLFWNQILICLSVKWRRLARSMRRGRHRYLLILNSFSNSINCTLVYAVLDLFWLTPSVLHASSVMNKNNFFRKCWKFKCERNDEKFFFISKYFCIFFQLRDTEILWDGWKFFFHERRNLKFKSFEPFFLHFLRILSQP